MSGASGTWDQDPSLWQSTLEWIDKGYNSTLGNWTGPIGLSIPTITVNGIDRSKENAKLRYEIDAKQALKMAVVFGTLLALTIYVGGKVKGN